MHYFTAFLYKSFKLILIMYRISKYNLLIMSSYELFYFIIPSFGLLGLVCLQIIANFILASCSYPCLTNICLRPAVITSAICCNTNLSKHSYVVLFTLHGLPFVFCSFEYTWVSENWFLTNVLWIHVIKSVDIYN